MARSIPACAGEPLVSKSFGLCLSLKVYPRVCGGTPALVSHAVDDAGLSPRVRGNLGGFPNLFAFARSIPACAGEPVVRIVVDPAYSCGSIPACAGEPLCVSL